MQPHGLVKTSHDGYFITRKRVRQNTVCFRHDNLLKISLHPLGYHVVNWWIPSVFSLSPFEPHLRSPSDANLLPIFQFPIILLQAEEHLYSLENAI